MVTTLVSVGVVFGVHGSSLIMELDGRWVMERVFVFSPILGMMVLSPVALFLLNPDVTLDSFIDQDRKEWRVELVRATFLPFEAEEILRIPISLRDVEDELYWVLSGDGIYRVKDAYAYSIFSVDQTSCSSGPDPVWRRLWKLKVPPKVCEFSWRACWDIIPHGVNLCKKGVSDYIFCNRCGKKENLRHLLFDCPWAKNFGLLRTCLF